MMGSQRVVIPKRQKALNMLVDKVDDKIWSIRYKNDTARLV